MTILLSIAGSFVTRHSWRGKPGKKRPVAGPWKMDEAYLRVKGEWVYLYRAIDEFGDTVDFMLSEKRDEAAATALFRQTIDGNSLPEKAVIDKSGSNNAGLENINMLLILAGIFCWIGILQVKYLNNRIEQDHRYIKKITKLMIGFKAVISNRPDGESEDQPSNDKIRKICEPQGIDWHYLPVVPGQITDEDVVAFLPPTDEWYIWSRIGVLSYGYS